MVIQHTDQFDICSLREIGVSRDLSSPCLPAGFEVRHEDHEVGISHRHRNPTNGAMSQRNGQLAVDFRHAHRRAELKSHSVTRGQLTSFQSGSGSDHSGFAAAFGAVPRGHTTGAVSRNFRFRTIGIDKANSQVRVGRRHDPLDAVSADTVMPVADSPAEIRDVRRSMFDPDDQEIIAAGAGFNKGN